MRRFAATLAAVLVASGCASVVGLDFDTYGVGLSSEGDGAAQCVPHATLRCLCALSEGVQTCSESGRLSACECRDSSSGAAPASAACGNGVVDEGEACDDGNLASDDGCSPLCVPDGRPPAVESCPGQPVAVAPGRAVRIDLATFARGSGDASGTCGIMSQPDRVYAVRPSRTGILTIAVTADAALAFSIRTTCATPGTALSCDAVGGGATVSRRVPVELGQTYFVVLEPQEASAQARYSITFGGS
ncbi:hypothetical protein BH11MYX4_BH11MYX4_05450 [soil metagenome]